LYKNSTETQAVEFFLLMPRKKLMSNNQLQFSAYGGKNWFQRTSTHGDEIGKIWSKCGVNSEWDPLKHVLLHPPGEEYSLINDPDEYQMLAVPDWKLAREQHINLAEKYNQLGIEVTYVKPEPPVSPNQIFCADLFFMTPEGAILARPASNVRAGEERWVARRLADMGIPILKTLTGNAVFEGADALWVSPDKVIIGCGLRTNESAIFQISQILKEIGVETIPIDLPIGTMHLMGILRFIDQDLIIVWPNRLAWKAVMLFKSLEFNVLSIPSLNEAIDNAAMNFVTVGPREILMSTGNSISQEFLESQKVKIHTVAVNELLKAAGGIGCLTGIIERDTG
jgi:N-dimethylarginine dimethylaminohydrolase